ncbi:MAG: hypothetical protein HC786_08060 [Richelia sp. CSU_2_1]|nr:hypothetical protein [Richelia sp. CSU_2_1]
MTKRIFSRVNCAQASGIFAICEGRRKKEEGRGKKEEGRRKKEEGRRKREEGRGKRRRGREGEF